MRVHMRSHVVMRSEEEQTCGYGLRDKERKSWRSKEKENDMLRTKCGECFGSNGSSSNGSYTEEEDEMRNQKPEATAVIFPATERRKRRRSPDSLPECENELKIGAFCLMMVLLRGAGGFVDHEEDEGKKRPGSVLSKFDFEINELTKAQSFQPESKVSQKTKKPKASLDKKDSGKSRRYTCTTRAFTSYQVLGGHVHGKPY